MKKLLAFITTVAIFALVLSSCKGHELCPAYGKAEPKAQAEKQV